jgi:hypothetical protein
MGPQRKKSRKKGSATKKQERGLTCARLIEEEEKDQTEE